MEGEPGIGKTRLLAAALEAARGRGLRVATACAEELERTGGPMLFDLPACWSTLEGECRS